jgi:hypothetical protein
MDDRKPKPLDIATSSPNPDAGTPLWLMGSHSDAERDRCALLMKHAAELLHELKAAAELLVDVCDYYRQQKPLPSALDCRRVAMDAWNVIALATGEITEGTWGIRRRTARRRPGRPWCV